MDLDGITTLSFDCYGTLIDWEAGLLAALRPWLKKNRKNPPDEQVLEIYGELEFEAEEAAPGALYPKILGNVHQALGEHFGIPSSAAEQTAFAASIGDWPAFPDSPGALKYLKQHFKLVILSNIDRASFALSEKKLGIKFDAVYTAEEIGSYKPDKKNFRYLLSRLKEDFGTRPDQLLHVAQSLFHDHEPAKKMNLHTCWIDRRAGRDGAGATVVLYGPIDYDFRFESMAEFTRAHMGAMG
ncbi:MAG: HAD hydrolase-like protein [Proteobacteria bacterium]|nr:HAD hydrolase-like protein [Pseudomonadota bacterium]